MPDIYPQTDFEVLNSAIDKESVRVDELIKDRRHIRYRSWSKIFINTSIGLAILALALSIAYWIFRTPVIEAQPLAPITAEEKTKRSESLSTILENQEAKPSTAENNEVKPNVLNKFTIFSQIDLPSGETVVTGKNFTPDNLMTPYAQYCYIDYVGYSNEFSGVHIAQKSAGKINYLTTKNDEILIVNKFCAFE